MPIAQAKSLAVRVPQKQQLLLLQVELGVQDTRGMHCHQEQKKELLEYAMAGTR